jgi:hypothetical protein
MDPSTLEKGKALDEMLMMFKQATTCPLSTSILKTPKHKIAPSNEVDEKGDEDHREDTLVTTRKSPKIKKKGSNGKTVIKLAHDLVAKKCGIMKEDEALDDMTRNQYLEMYKKPITKDSMAAIISLTEVIQDKKKDKNKKKQKITEITANKAKEGHKKEKGAPGRVLV